MKLVQACLSAERYEIVVLTIVAISEARVGLIMSQERSGKCFSPLWSFCEARGGMFKYQETSRKLINHRGEPVKHVEACISARKDLESSFHHCGVSVMLVQT